MLHNLSEMKLKSQKPQSSNTASAAVSAPTTFFPIFALSQVPTDDFGSLPEDFEGQLRKIQGCCEEYFSDNYGVCATNAREWHADFDSQTATVSPSHQYYRESHLRRSFCDVICKALKHVYVDMLWSVCDALDRICILLSDLQPQPNDNAVLKSDVDALHRSAASAEKRFANILQQRDTAMGDRFLQFIRGERNVMFIGNVVSEVLSRWETTGFVHEHSHTWNFPKACENSITEAYKSVLNREFVRWSHAQQNNQDEEDMLAEGHRLFDPIMVKMVDLQNCFIYRVPKYEALSPTMKAAALISSMTTGGAILFAAGSVGAFFLIVPAVALWPFSIALFSAAAIFVIAGLGGASLIVNSTASIRELKQSIINEGEREQAVTEIVKRMELKEFKQCYFSLRGQAIFGHVLRNLQQWKDALGSTKPYQGSPIDVGCRRPLEGARLTAKNCFLQYVVRDQLTIDCETIALRPDGGDNSCEYIVVVRCYQRVMALCIYAYSVEGGLVE